jgi:hypothetical protein
MKENKLPRLLLIAGTGRNSGKTTFACNIIHKYAATHSIVSVKISSHFHSNVTYDNAIISNPDLYIAEEKSRDLKKDSSLMLAAGARKSFFIMAKDDQLHQAYSLLMDHISENDYIVCESGGLREIVQPGVFLIFHNNLNSKHKSSTAKLLPLCDRFITLDKDQIDFDIHNLIINNNSWHIKNNDNLR